MGKLILSIYVSVDGFISGPNGELDMLPDTPETSQYAIDLLDTADAILLGGGAYEVFESYWPTASTDPTTLPSDLPLAQHINALPKYVFSDSLEKVNWNATIIHDDIPAEVAKLKERYAKNLVLFGGAQIAQTLMHHGLIDEYQLLVCPFILGEGKPLFTKTSDRINLKLIKTDALYPSNIAALYYRPNTLTKSYL